MAHFLARSFGSFMVHFWLIFGSFLAQNWLECQGFAVTFLKGTFWLEKGKFLTSIIETDLA